MASFSPSNSGRSPIGGLTLSGDTLYGVTYNSTNTADWYGDGAVFSVPVAGGDPTILTFFNGSNGAKPLGDLTLIGDTLYGTTQYGGAAAQAQSLVSRSAAAVLRRWPRLTAATARTPGAA